MTPEQWIATGAKIDEMIGRGFFMAVWSKGAVTNGRSYFEYPQWRVQFQRGAMKAAPLMDAEGLASADTFDEAVKLAYNEAMAGLLDWEQSYEESNGVKAPLTGRE